jgi:H/ACA ribonucleoprotein complex subunit 2
LSTKLSIEVNHPRSNIPSDPIPPTHENPGERYFALKRGVKEVQKAIRARGPVGYKPGPPDGIVVIAGDTSPYDVISHFPVLCEDAKIPYVFVRSRAELGRSGETKRATSIIMVTREGRKRQPKKAPQNESAEDKEKREAKEAEDGKKETERAQKWAGYYEEFADFAKVASASTAR